MDGFLDLLADNRSVPGRLVTTAAISALAVVVAMVIGHLASRNVEDNYNRYYTRKMIRYAVVLVWAVSLAVVWRAFAGRVGVVLGLAAAGVAFAMQEAIGALAGWFNIVAGRIFRVGDRIQMGGVRGDVVDITPLRTKIMEMGSANEEDAWVRGRQYTGRLVAISNKATFTEPVFNYSTGFEFLWEELSLPISYEDDWHHAERILQEEVNAVSRNEGADVAIQELSRRYPMPRTEIEPRVFVRATDNWMELSARFVVPLRTARSTKDQLTRRVLSRLEEAGIPIASETQDLTIHLADGSPTPEGPQG